MAESKKKTSGVRRRFHGFRFLTLFMAILVGFELVGATVALYGLNTWLKGKPEIDVADFFTQESTLIYDMNGTEIADVGTQLRENITYDQVPDALIDAFLAIEDSRYFTHNGFDIPRFGKAVIETLTHGNLQGGSTFTMQLVKLTYFVNDEDGTSRTKDIEYKIQQIALAMDLEKRSTKKEIFEMYLNKMNYGGIGNIRGVQKAAQQYFDKNVWDLNTSECALLAGVVNSPYYYDPHNYLDHATDRRNEVIDMMVHHGYLTADDGALAKAIKVEDLLVDPYKKMYDGEAYQYQAYIDEVIKEAERVTGNDPLTVSMEIYTSMDPEVQDAMESILSGEWDGVEWPNDKIEYAIISENNQTGEIVGIGGGRNYSRGGTMLLNHATDQYNQPGSTVKPFLDYLLAFEFCGWATDHTICDQPVAYGNFVFQNAYTNGYSGDMLLTEALGRSLNTPAIQTLQAVIDEVGSDRVCDYLESLNFATFDRNEFNIQYAIGGATFRTSAKELMAAHAVNMNGGYYIEPHTIKRIVYRSGLSDPVEFNYTGTQVVSSQAAYMMSTLLEKNVSTNFQNFMQLLARSYPVYAKTGTTDWGDSGLQYGIPLGSAKDNWMVAETNHFTTVVWYGYDKLYEDTKCWFDYSDILYNMNGYIQNYLLDIINRNVDCSGGVPRPDGISEITHIKGLYPYTAPISGMSGEYISTGLIKSEYNTLAQPQAAAALSSLASFSASVDDNFNVSFNWSAYPDPSKLEKAGTYKDISLRYANGGVWVGASGRRMFDYSWVYGNVEYKARVSQNGQTLREISSGSEHSTENLNADLAEGTETTVCGYYAYSTGSSASNEVCSSFTTPIRHVYAPAEGTSYDDIMAWANAHGFEIKVSYQVPDDAHPEGTMDLRYNGHTCWGADVKGANRPFQLNVYAYH